jgi:uncharacterized membrane protein YgcG
MIANLLVLVASLALLFNTGSAASLRSQLDGRDLSSLPVDNELIQKVTNYAGKKSVRRIAKEHKEVTEMMAHFHAEAKAHLAAHKSFKQGSIVKSDIITGPPGPAVPVLHHGSVVIRSRPNGDCSGVPSTLQVDRLDGGCVNDGPYSYSMSCAHENKDGEVSMWTTSFGAPDCNDMYGTNSFQLMSGKKCRIGDSYSYEGFADLPYTKTLQCAANKRPEDYIYEHGGMITYSYNCEGGGCGCEAESVQVERFHSCNIMYEYFNEDGSPSPYPTYSDKNRFFYYTYDSCDTSGMMQATKYSDSACTRPLARAHGREHGLGQCNTNQGYGGNGGNGDGLNGGDGGNGGNGGNGGGSGTYRMVCVPEGSTPPPMA